MLDEFTPQPAEPQFQRLADARRVLKVTGSLAKAPVLDADERLEIHRIRAFAVRYIGLAVEELVETLDALDDPDLEPNGDELDGDRAEDEAGAELYARLESGPGCGICDPSEHSIEERHGKQPELKQSPAHEDREDDDAAEEDDGGGDVVSEDEPAFDPLSRAIANVMGADGPGGGSLLDSDCEDGI